MKLLALLSRFRASFAGRVLGNSSWGFASNLITVFTGLLQVSLVTRALGVEQYGVLAVIMAFPTMVQQFAGLRTWEMVARYSAAALHNNQLEEAGHIALLGFSIDFLIALISITIVWLGGSLYMQATLGSTEYVGLLYFYTVVVLFTAPVATTQALLRVFGKFHLIFVQSIIANVLRLVFVLVAYVIHTGLFGMLFAYMAASFGNAATSLVFCLWQARGRIVFKFGSPFLAFIRKNRRDLTSFLGAGYVEASLLGFARNFDIMLIARLGGAEQAGIYRAAQSLVNMFAGFLAPMMNAVLPDLQRSIKLPWGILRRRLWSLSAMSGSLYLPGAMILTLIAPWLITTFMGADFAAASTPAAIMVWGTAVAGTLFWLPGLMLTLNRQWMRTAVLTMAVGCQFLVLFLLTPGLGAVGAAWAFFAMQSIYYLTLLFTVIVWQPAIQQPDLPVERDARLA